VYVYRIEIEKNGIKSKNIRTFANVILFEDS